MHVANGNRKVPFRVLGGRWVPVGVDARERRGYNTVSHVSYLGPTSGALVVWCLAGMAQTSLPNP